jgi:lysophospholipid acyltransferase (LPLAT)-like uncharacterized protein
MSFFKKTLKKIKNKIKNHRFFLTGLDWVLRQLQKTLSITLKKDLSYNPTQQYLFAFWHHAQILPVLWCQAHETPCAALVSPSRDGQIVSDLLIRRGVKTIRGSSRANTLLAMKEMTEVLNKGYSLGFAVDGPIGPKGVIKPGIIYLSKKYNIPILPIRCTLNKKWILKKTWDQLEIPKLWAQGDIQVGPVMICEPQESLAQSLEKLYKLLNH